MDNYIKCTPPNVGAFFVGIMEKFLRERCEKLEITKRSRTTYTLHGPRITIDDIMAIGQLAAHVNVWSEPDDDPFIVTAK